MFYDLAIDIKGICKYYPTYKSPIHRLKNVIASSISTKYVTYNNNDFCALKNITFSIERGEVVGILGKNGSGKSTLLQTICKTLSPTLGEITVNGRVAALLELGAGFNPEFTGRENIYLNAAILGLNKCDIDNKIDTIIRFSEIESYIDKPVKHYSSGMYVRLAFSIAINVDPDILIIDEALSVGDIKFQAKCIKKIKDIVETGKTVLFVSHDITSVRTLCKRAIWLDKGEIVMDDDVFETTSKYLEFMYSDEKDLNKIDSIKINNKNDLNNYINHWGKHKGSFKEIMLLNDNGEKVSVFEIDSKMIVNLKFSLPKTVDLSKSKIAISIKNLKGIDLIVFTHSLSECLKESSNIEVKFHLQNQLSTGEYYLVVALEDSDDSEVSYFEYIEGAIYFTSTSKIKSHGLFNPSVWVEFC